MYYDEESEPLKPKKKGRKRKAEKTTKVSRRQETYEDFWNDDAGGELEEGNNEHSNVQVKFEPTEFSDDEEEMIVKRPRKKRITKKGNEVACHIPERKSLDRSGKPKIPRDRRILM